MSTLKEAETSNAAIFATLQPVLPPIPTTNVHLPQAGNPPSSVGSLTAQFPALETKVQPKSWHQGLT